MMAGTVTCGSKFPNLADAHGGNERATAQPLHRASHFNIH